MNNELEYIKQKMTERVEDVARYLLPNGKLVGDNWKVGNVDNENGESLSVSISGGFFKDFCTTDKGDLLELWQLRRGVDFKTSLQEVKEFLGIKPSKILPRDAYKHKSAIPPTIKPKLDALKIGEVNENHIVRKYLTENRKLTVETLAKFDIRVKDREIIFPFKKNNEVILVKYLSIDRDADGNKKMWTAKNAASCLFGWQAVNDSFDELVICEGEIDALSLHQYGYNAVSLPQGTGSANGGKWIEEDRELLNKYQKIYLCLDNDEPGKKGLQPLANILGKDRCFIVELPRKDANECLQAGLDIKEYFEKAKSARKKVDIDYLTNLLDRVTQDAWNDVETLLEVAKAFAFETHFEDAYFSVFDRYLKRSKHYDVRLLLRVKDEWKKEIEDDYTGLGTLLLQASLGGYKIQTQEELDAIAQGRTATRYQLQRDLKNWVYVKPSRQFVNLSLQKKAKKQDDYIYKESAIENVYRPLFPKGLVIRQLLPFLIHVHGMEYLPGNDTIYKNHEMDYLNTWRPSGIEPKEGDVTPLFELFDYVYGVGYREIIFKWMAWIVQNPAERHRWALLLMGKEQQVGKSTVCELMIDLLGRHNVKMINSKCVDDKFTGWIVDTQMAVIPELEQFDRRNLYDHLKHYIKDKNVAVRSMIVNPGDMVVSYANFVFTSNSDVPIIIPEGDTRFGVIKPIVTEKTKRPKSYYDQFHSWKENNYSQILNFLLNVDLRGYDHRNPPDTPDKESLISGIISDSDDMDVALWLETNKRTIVTLKEVSNAMIDMFNNPALMSEKSLGYHISKSCEHLKRIRIGNNRHQFYCLRDYATLYKSWAPAQIIDQWEKERMGEIA